MQKPTTPEPRDPCRRGARRQRQHAGATLTELYVPDVTPSDLRRAHSALDRVVDPIYRRARFTSERERVEYLFAVYERLQAPFAAAQRQLLWPVERSGSRY